MIDKYFKEPLPSSVFFVFNPSKFGSFVMSLISRIISNFDFNFFLSCGKMQPVSIVFIFLLLFLNCASFALHPWILSTADWRTEHILITTKSILLVFEALYPIFSNTVFSRSESYLFMAQPYVNILYFFIIWISITKVELSSSPTFVSVVCRHLMSTDC